MFYLLAATWLLADAATVIAGLYWIGLIVGGGLLLVSVLGGGDHHAADVDTGGFDLDHAGGDVDFHGGDMPADAGHAEVDAVHAHHAAAALSTWFSVRFVIFFVALFGAFGVILRHFSDLGTWIAFCLALFGGLVGGQGVHHVFRAIRRSSGDSATRPQDYVHKLARVTIAIHPPDKGEVALQVRGGERFVPAVSDGSGRFAAGDEVVVVGYRAGIAHVVSQSDYQQRVQIA